MPTSLVIDIENIDEVLGKQLLGHKPSPFERTNYQRVLEFVREKFGKHSVTAFAVVRENHRAVKFYECLRHFGYRLVFAEQFAAREQLCRIDSPEIVDHVVMHLLRVSGSENLLYMGHDGYGTEAAEILKEKKQRGAYVAAIGFPELMASGILFAVHEVFDLRTDIGATGSGLSDSAA